MKNKKKGFTLVELLVVIAILAILATVSVVGYLAFTEKAKESNDISLTTQMNTVLQANEAQDKAETMSDVVSQLDEAGLGIEKLTPTSSGYSFVWDKETNRIFLLDEEKKVVSPEGASLSDNTENIMAIVHDGDELTTWTEANYGVYLASGFPTTELPDSLEKAVSFDAGELTLDEITISFLDDKDIYIAGNYDTLTISAASAGVDFYGDATFVNATTADHSLHVYGHIQELTLNQGKVVVKANAEVNAIDAASATNGSSINVETSGIVGAVIVKGDGENVSIDSSLNDVKVEYNESTNGLFAGGVGTETSPYLISNESEFLNISTMSKNGDYYYLQIKDLEISNGVENFKGIFNADNHSLEVVNYNGTFFSLFKSIIGHSTFKNLEIIQSTEFATNLLLDADFGTDYGADFENITISGTTTKTNVGNFGFLIINAIYTVGEKSVVYNFKNIVNNVDLQNTGDCTGILIGSGPCFNTQTTLNFENIVNNGDIVGGNVGVGFLYGNPAYIGSMENGTINISNCINNGVIMSTSNDATVAFAPKLETVAGWEDESQKWQSLSGGDYITSNYFTNKTVYINQTGSEYKTNVSGNVGSNITFRLAINITRLDSGENYQNNTTKFYVDVVLDDSVSSNRILEHKAIDLQRAKELFGNSYSFNFNDDGIQLLEKNGVMYVILRDYEIGRNNVEHDGIVGESSIKLQLHAFEEGILRGIYSFN